MSTSSLPRWDMAVIFPGLPSPELAAEVDWAKGQIRAFDAMFDSLGIEKGGKASLADLDRVLDAVNEFYERFETLMSFVGCTVTVDTRNEAALALESELDALGAEVRKQSKRLTAWLGGLDLAQATTPVAAAHRYALERAQITASHLMPPDQEDLASDMELSGSVAWGKLYSAVSSQVPVPIELGGEQKTLPMSAVRALASDPDPEVRRVAYEAELKAWKTVEVPIAAALNGIKGETLLKNRRRGWGSPLDEACFNASIDRGTLDAMMTAARESFPDFRRYLRAKARAIGKPVLAFHDLFAPVGEDTGEWSFDKAETFVADQFRTYSDRLADFALRSFRERWIDAEPRTGKVDGAYCAPMRRDESRILMNFKGSFDSVRTLAHELGHGYHNLCLYGRTPMQRDIPMTLAETASIFCETIVKRGVLANGTEAEKLATLEGAIQGACGVVVDISSRFLFESAVFDLRAQREVSAREFSEMMLDAQRATYGDGLDPERLHGYMWAAKPHYYGSSFYNFPYMFGLLFGLGLYSVYEKEGKAFQARYDGLLANTGMADAATLAAQFGIDIRTPDFWRGSLDVVRADIAMFETMV